MSYSVSKKQNIKELDLTGWTQKRRRGSEGTQNVSNQSYLLSDLPDDILYHIFSFLGDNDLIRLCGVSRKFQNMSATSPYLKFALSNNYARVTCICKQFSMFMKNLLELRKLEPQKPELNKREKIVQLRFSFSCSVHRKYAIHEEWMKNASECGIDKLHLKVYELPICLLSCESIKELHLCMRKNAVTLPKITLASLETLIMDSMEVTQSVGRWVSKYFPSLKCLSLKNITFNRPLTICISSLENLMISDDYIWHIKIWTEKLQNLDFCSGSLTHYHKSKERKVEISAPNIQTLTWKGVPRRFSCREGLRELQRAIINAEEWRKDSKANVNCARLVELLQGVRWARHLHLDSWILKVLLEIPPILFENLSHLSLRLERDDAHYIIAFLEKYGDINSLCIEESHVASYHEDWGSSSNSSENGYHQFQGNSFLPLILASNFKFERKNGSLELGVISIHGLKEVKIKISQFKKEIILVIHMLMKSAKDLVKMTITYPSHMEFQMRRIGLQNLINNFERASSSLAVYMVPR